MSRDFLGQQPGETIQFVIRRHHSMMYRQLSMSIIMVVLGLLVGISPIITGSMIWLRWTLAGLIVLLGLTMLFSAWLRWYYSIYIVTNHRIRQQIQHSLFKKKVIDIYLNKIENISYNISGIAGSMSGYGNIIIHTVAGDLLMTRIPNCEAIHSQLVAISEPSKLKKESEKED